ncbi:hypothetical protein RRF57_002283 [Xylaria bambusicola]|uniref:Uncharacterized protein n=1 Tax=Xylaria bambusicola TaxID=326684 RepID=A0AAN7UEB4_9PEZI
MAILHLRWHPNDLATMATGTKRKREDSPTVTPTLVVGIDLGTTFSGVSWSICQSGSRASNVQPEVISSWPTSPDNRRKSSDSPQVPTKIHYGKDGEIWWGFRIPVDVETIEWLNRLLLDDENLHSCLKESIQLQAAKKLMSKFEKTGVQVVGDYLKMLWDHSLEQIRNEAGPADVDRMAFDVVLTCPPGWPSYTEDRMREAAKLAGIFSHREPSKTTLTTISEHRAAALACMSKAEYWGDLQVGDSVVILNAGGVTVSPNLDISRCGLVFQLKASLLSTNNYNCALCGGTFLDHGFKSLLKHVVGDVSWNKMNTSDIRKMMNNEWEHEIKGTFSQLDDTYIVELPSSAQCEAVHLQSIDLQPTYDQIVSQIAKLVQNQILTIKKNTSQPPKLVILVGGFGRSTYLLQYLRGIFRSQIPILQACGNKPWTAACHGATLSRVAQLCSAPLDKDQHQSQVACCSYGWTANEVFDAKVHDIRDRVWSEAMREWHSADQMKWFIKRGEDISQNKTRMLDRWQSWTIHTKGWGTSIIQVFACDDLNPPSRMQDNIRCVGEIHARTPKPVEMLTKVDDGPVSYRKWAFKVKVVISRASLDFFLVSDGKEKELLTTIPTNLE